ncbi:hypothetical protein CC1G_04937 [Coprinopsis cinerea okayama7|uniref:Major facilitator superfamily (MFS) profile domain-containing protein n=1 Tax=Coprinopsis cinerea (strain Okayama-7 / 130 / ATCC MYA-4618 / FGSC 9003) TaxID=240176 RepID=A8PFL8_COPC7|nr:hypothetical protein CC1G_04937 [Coprinopsis cinerea okayama7\|eukprot:XP_001841093.1 hypothetical protein CC1G_04937 [Coprinopsis cinerea okayama7\
MSLQETEQTPLLHNQNPTHIHLNGNSNNSNVGNFGSTSTSVEAEIEATPTKKDAHDLIYERFSVPRKRAILAMLSAAGLMPLFVGGTFIPCIPQIAKDLDVPPGTISLAVSISVLATSLGALWGSTYSGFYGRRPIYLAFLPLSVLGSLGVSVATTIPELMVWRFLQAFGVSPALSVGAGVIGDIYRLEERGTAMGVFFAAVLLGPALAPLAGGTAAHYSSWRTMQALVGITVLLVYLTMVFLFPETSHPGTRGIDHLRKAEEETGRRQVPQWRPVLLNPFKGMALLRSPNLFLTATAAFVVLAVDYVLLIPIAYTIGKKYNITNEALIGACFLPNGLGSMLGAPIAGRISDHLVVKWRSKRGMWYPEDRLRAALPGALFLVPLSVLFAGFLTAAFRSTLLAMVIAIIMPSIERIGVFYTNAIAACVGWVGFG